MAGTGTGYPLTFRCAKCRRYQFVVTGKTKPLSARQRGMGHPRATNRRHEYKCLSCGHVGWSRHSDMATARCIK